MIDVRTLVQARMSSARFPGKMLASLSGRPMVAHVLSRCAEAIGDDRVVLVTSTDATDDPLARFVEQNTRIAVFRGELDDVMRRFQSCLQRHPCEWFVRISGDSPAIDPALIRWMIAQRSTELDLLTNVQRRTFPSGQSVEVVKSATFARFDSEQLTAEEREHLTQHFYRHPDTFRIRNVVLEADPPHRRMVVDTPEDLVAMESILKRPAFAFATRARLDEAGA